MGDEQSLNEIKSNILFLLLWSDHTLFMQVLETTFGQFWMVNFLPNKYGRHVIIASTMASISLAYVDQERFVVPDS